MHNKRFFAVQLIFAVLLVVSFSCCTDSSDSGESSVAAETQNYDSQSSSGTSINSEIMDLVENQNELWSYSYEYTLNSEMEGQISDISGSGKIDMRNKKAYISLKSESESMEYYYFENEIYMGTTSGGETQWMKSSANGQDFESNFDIASQYDKNVYDLENNDFTLEGEETVNGIRCYKLKMDVKNMINYAIAENVASNGDITDLEQASIVYYIDKSNGYVIKTTTNIKGTDEAGEPFEFNYEMSLKNINEVQDITIPAEAENAMDMSSYYSNY
ncbi:LolA-like protein [Methanococcus sp. CF]